MTEKEIINKKLRETTDKLAKAVSGRKYVGELSEHILKVIRSGNTNYSMSSLLDYCNGTNIQLVMTDMATTEEFYPNSTSEVHDILIMLMDRYEVDSGMIYRRTATHYRMSKAELEDHTEKTISIKVCLAACEVICCDLSFKGQNDESNVRN